MRLGHSLGMETVAEGIEDHEQFLAMRRVGSELGQGFYFFRPTTVDEIDRLLSGPDGQGWDGAGGAPSTSKTSASA